MHPKIKLEKITCNFWNSKILPASFWTCELGYGCQGSLYVSPSGWSLRLSCLLLSSTPLLALAALAAPYLCSHLAQCPPLSLHRHPARCDVYLTSLSPSPRLCLISAASLPEQRVLSPCFLNFRCIYSVRRCSGRLGYTGEQNQQRSLPLWGLHSSKGTQTRSLNK